MKYNIKSDINCKVKIMKTFFVVVAAVLLQVSSHASSQHGEIVERVKAWTRPDFPSYVRADTNTDTNVFTSTIKEATDLSYDQSTYLAKRQAERRGENVSKDGYFLSEQGDLQKADYDKDNPEKGGGENDGGNVKEDRISTNDSAVDHAEDGISSINVPVVLFAVLIMNVFLLLCECEASVFKVLPHVLDL